jgi:hypothetical protein
VAVETACERYRALLFQGLTTHSPYIQDINPITDSILGSFNLTSADTFEVVSVVQGSGEKTSLKCPRQNRNFNWVCVTPCGGHLALVTHTTELCATPRMVLPRSRSVSQPFASGRRRRVLCHGCVRVWSQADVTLEVYGIETCSDFAAGAMTFSKMVVWDVNMAPIKQAWQLTTAKPCNGSIRYDGNADIVVSHN